MNRFLHQIAKDNHVHIPVQKQRHVPVHVPVERPIEVPESPWGDLFLRGESCCEKKHPKTGGDFFCLECFFCQKIIQHPRNLLISIYWDFFLFWLIDSPKRCTSFKNVVSEVETRRKTKNQWLFLVPLIGGRWYIITQLAVYTTYIPLIYCQLGLWEPGNSIEKSWGECHWNLGEGDWCASGETGGSATGRPNSRGGQCEFFFFGALNWVFFWVLGWYKKKGNTSNFKHMQC